MLFNTPGDGLLALSYLPPRELDLVLVDLVGGTRKRLLVGVVVVVLSQEQGQEQAARQKMFDSMDLKSTGVITFDEWLKFCREHIAAKTATMDPHPIIDHGSVEEYKKFISAAISNSSSSEAVELYWYMLEIFTEQDGDKDGIVKLAEFPSMMNQVLVIPQKHGLSVPAQDQFEALFKKYDPRNDGRLTVDEWMSLAKEEVFKKFL